MWWKLTINANLWNAVVSFVLDWSIVVPELILLGLCLRHWRLGRGMGLVLAGLLLLTLVSVGSNLLDLPVVLGTSIQLTDTGNRTGRALALFFIRIAQAVVLLALLLLAGGVTLVLRGIRQRLEQARIEILRLSGDRRSERN